MNTIFRDARRIHMIGIKGQGMAALAEILVSQGKKITGSDTSEIFSTDQVLKSLSISVRGFSAKNINTSLNLVIRSSAYGNEHEEVLAAKKKGIPIAYYSEVISEIFNAHRGMLVTGTHGKTTTTAMIGRVLEDAGVDPTVLVGGTVVKWQKNARVGRGEWMIAEGDEYQNKFLSMNPEILVVTSIEYDHPDFFKTKKAYEQVFRRMVEKLPPQGLLIAEKHLRKILSRIPCKVIWYGIPGKSEGKHWELNKMAAKLVGERLGISAKKTEKTLVHFEGTARRTEFYTKLNAHTVIIDDYAHHPTEIKTTLADIRCRYPKRRITALFQPHTYSRTYTLLADFSRAFGNADEVIVLPIYSSAREKKGQFPQNLEKMLSEKIAQRGKKNKVFVMTFEEAIHYCKKLSPIKQKRVIITLGAGDGWQIAKSLTKT